MLFGAAVMSEPSFNGAPARVTSASAGDFAPTYGGELPPGYGGIWDPHHHCLGAGQNGTTIGTYPELITFNPDIVWPRQQCGTLVTNHHHHRASRGGSGSGSAGSGGSSSGGGHHSSKKTRRRVATIAQRRAANIRERRRMYNLNEAFDKLRRKVPTFAYEKRLSRIETLRLAITYIGFMTELLHGHAGHSAGGGVAGGAGDKTPHGDYQHHRADFIPYGIIN